MAFFNIFHHAFVGVNVDGPSEENFKKHGAIQYIAVTVLFNTRRLILNASFNDDAIELFFAEICFIVVRNTLQDACFNLLLINKWVLGGRGL